MLKTKFKRIKMSRNKLLDVESICLMIGFISIA